MESFKATLRCLSPHPVVDINTVLVNLLILPSKSLSWISAFLSVYIGVVRFHGYASVNRVIRMPGTFIGILSIVRTALGNRLMLFSSSRLASMDFRDFISSLPLKTSLLLCFFIFCNLRLVQTKYSLQEMWIRSRGWKKTRWRKLETVLTFLFTCNVKGTLKIHFLILGFASNWKKI